MKNNNNSNKNKITNPILHIHIQISLSSKFQIQQFWFYGKCFFKKWYICSKQKKNEYQHWFLHTQIGLSIKFQFKLTTLFFPYLKRVFWVSNKLNKKSPPNHNQILHIWIRLCTELQFKLEILIFLDQIYP